MPYIITEDGSIKYGDTIEEAKEEWGEESAPVARQRDEYKDTDTKKITPDQEKEEPEKEKTAMFESGPLAWAEETLVTAGSFLNHLPDTLVSGTQKWAQSADPDFWDTVAYGIMSMGDMGAPVKQNAHYYSAKAQGFIGEDGEPDTQFK